MPVGVSHSPAEEGEKDGAHEKDRHSPQEYSPPSREDYNTSFLNIMGCP